MLKQDFASLMSAMAQDTEGFTVTLPDEWLQGRTAYGGLSAALCWEAAQRSTDALPPLRSAQFAFIGPAIGRLIIKPTLLRRGKSAAFIGVDLFGDAGLAVRGLLCFGTGRDSALHLVDLRAPAVPHWDDCSGFFEPSDQRKFLSHFEGRLAGGARPFTPGEEPEMIVWLRHVDATSSMAGLIALADALPPASMVIFPPERAPISTMTWSFDILTDLPQSASGWWLVRNTAQSAVQGYSAQDMTLWNDAGEPIMAMRQTVAIFT